MKIICTVQEFGELVRKCEREVCNECMLNNICDGSGFESLISAENIVPDKKGDNEDV